MKILFDFQIFYLQKQGGISRYFAELSAALSKLDCPNEIIAPFSDNIYLEKQRSQMVLGEWRANFRREHPYRALRWNTSYNRFRQNLSPAGIVHETYYTHPVLSAHQRVITIHDMIYELYGGKSDEEKLVLKGKAEAIRRASHIIAVSESTRRDLLKFYPEAENKTTVIYHGVSEPAGIAFAWELERPFFLFVGNRSWYKNYEGALKAFAAFVKEGRDYDLVCFGGGNETESEKRLAMELNVHDRIQFVSGPDELLNRYYTMAMALLYTSRYEGFGLPVIEAMRHCCPVICSAGSSLPEVAGQAALMVNVEDTREILQPMIKLHEDWRFRRDMLDPGIAQSLKFTWERCARETLEVYQKLSL